MRESRLRVVVARALAAATFTAFLGYYGLLCIRPDWGGDFQMYCAGIARLYRDMQHPLHEAMPVPGSQSTVYTPYLVVLAVIGKLFGLTPFRVLQGAGVFNLVAFSCGVGFLFSRVSMHRLWLLPAACFIFTTLCLRWLHFGWSSETSLTNLQYVQPYPSTLAWALAFVAFGLLFDLRRKERARDWVWLVAVLGMLLGTHVLTASWVAGIVGLFGLWWSVQRRAFKPMAWTAGALVAAIGLAWLWPYAEFFGQGSLRGINEGSRFGNWPWIDFPNLYAVGLVCFGYCALRMRQHAFWFASMLATLAALGVWRLIGFSFGNRYAFFAAFFPQLIVAEVMALGIFALVGALPELPPQRRRPEWDMPLLLVVLFASCTAWLRSPMVARGRQKKDFGTLWSPAAILRRPSPHAVYHERYRELLPTLSEQDVIILPESRMAFDLVALTNASVVISPNAHRVSDRMARSRSVAAFFNPKTSPEARFETAHRYGASKILVPSRNFDVLDALTETFGVPVHRSEAWAILTVPR